MYSAGCKTSVCLINRFVKETGGVITAHLRFSFWILRRDGLRVYAPYSACVSYICMLSFWTEWSKLAQSGLLPCILLYKKYRKTIDGKATCPFHRKITNVYAHCPERFECTCNFPQLIFLRYRDNILCLL
jgi:hypothetical protein